jgi:hypothetical protein
MGARSDQPDRGDCGQPDRPPRLAVRSLRQAQVGAAPTQEWCAGRRGAAPAAAVPVATVPAPAGAGAKMSSMLGGRRLSPAGAARDCVGRCPARSCPPCRPGLLRARPACRPPRPHRCLRTRAGRFPVARIIAAGIVWSAPWALAVAHDRVSEKGARRRAAGPRKAVMRSLIRRDRVKNRVSFPKFVC